MILVTKLRIDSLILRGLINETDMDYFSNLFNRIFQPVYNYIIRYFAF